MAAPLERPLFSSVGEAVLLTATFRPKGSGHSATVPQGFDEGRAGRVTLEEARRRLRELQASWDYAFAMGHGCSIGGDPRFTAIRREVADLSAIIAEHVTAEPGA